MNKQLAAVVALVALLAAGCARSADVPAGKADAKKVVDDFQKALETEDMGLVSQIMAHDADMVNFGTDAAERWVGYDALKKAMEEQFAAFKNVKLSVRDQVLHMAPSGKVAWFSEVADWNMLAQGKPAAVPGTRITGVLEKRDAGWVIVQFHVSAPVAGQAASY